MYRETTGPQGTTTVTVCVCTHERPCARTTTLVHAQRVSVCVTRKQRERKKREGRVCLTESCAYWVMCACMGARERAPGRSCACVCRLCANAAARKKVRAFLHVRGSARPQIHRLSVCMRACAFVPPPAPSTPCLRSLLFFRPNIRTLEKMSTRFPLHSPCFLPGLFRRRWGVGRCWCCSLACRFWRINPLAMAAAMSPPKRTQPRLRPCLQSLRLCPPKGTERGRSQTRNLRSTGYHGPILQPRGG